MAATATTMEHGRYRCFLGHIFCRAMPCCFFPWLKIQGSVKGPIRVPRCYLKGGLGGIRAAQFQYVLVCQAPFKAWVAGSNPAALTTRQSPQYQNTYRTSLHKWTKIRNY